MASAVDEFGVWLIDKLKSLNTDENVFGSYISGILDGDDTGEEKQEALESLLSDITDKDIDKHVGEIMDKWNLCHPVEVSTATTSSSNVEEQLVKLLGSQALVTTVPKQYTEEEKKLRQAILQYSQLSDDEECETAVGSNDADGDLDRNTNAANVAAAARERREQAKLESQKKKEKDKEDREKQRQLREEKKEKRKTLKNERKR